MLFLIHESSKKKYKSFENYFVTAAFYLKTANSKFSPYYFAEKTCFYTPTLKKSNKLRICPILLIKARLLVQKPQLTIQPRNKGSRKRSFHNLSENSPGYCSLSFSLVDAVYASRKLAHRTKFVVRTSVHQGRKNANPASSTHAAECKLTRSRASYICAGRSFFSSRARCTPPLLSFFYLLLH